MQTKTAAGLVAQGALLKDSGCLRMGLAETAKLLLSHGIPVEEILFGLVEDLVGCGAVNTDTEEVLKAAANFNPEFPL